MIIARAAPPWTAVALRCPNILAYSSTSCGRVTSMLAVGVSSAAAPAMVIPGYTDDVKTAISLPDDTYEQATRQAAELGISRSEFFARAARSYLDQLAAHSLTRQINEALQTTEDDSNAAAAAAGRRHLAGQDDW